MAKTKLRKSVPFKTDVCQTMFKAHLAEADPEYGRFQITLVVDDKQRADLEAILDEVGKASFGDKVPEFKGFKESEDGETFIKFDSKHQPTVVDSEGMTVAPSAIPALSGGTVRVGGMCKAYTKPSKGLKLYLQGVQIVSAGAGMSFDAVEGGSFKGSTAPGNDNAAVEGSEASDLDDEIPF